MPTYQHQEQEDLMTDFDRPARKDVVNSSRRLGGESGRKAWNIPSYKKQAPKQTLKPIFFKQTQAREAARKSAHIPQSTSNSMSTKNGERTKVAGAAEIRNVLSCDSGYDDVFDDFSDESFTMLFEDTKKLLISTAETFSNLGSMDNLVSSCSVAYQMTKEVIQEVVKYEEEMKYLTSATLLLYGGSWKYLAGILAAVDTFGTQKVLEEAWRVGIIFLSDDLEEDSITPADILETCRELGLHIALLIAATVSPSWAEICITVALASKFSCLIPVKDTLKSAMSMPEDENSEIQDYFSVVDDSWFDLLAVIASNILSLTLFACFPRLVTAMYMGYIGASISIESLMNRARESEFCDFEMFYRNFGLNKRMQFYILGFVAAMSLWQALSGYTGICMFLSWLMFLHPLVRAYNMITADFEETKDIKVE